MTTHDEPAPSRRELVRSAALVAAAVAVGETRTRASDAATSTAASTIPATATSASHRIVSANILLDLAEHKGTPLDWAAMRREACVDLLRAQRADILCLQEVGRPQNEDFARAFPTFSSFGYDDPYVDTRPGRFLSIKNVILFSTDRYELRTGGTYWLSETPCVPGSHLPDEGLPRHVNWVRLRDRATGKQFRVLNTHWGLKQPMRLPQAPVIAADTQQYADDFPQLLCGDFNSIASSEEQRILRDAGWTDTYAAVHGALHASTSTTTPTTTATDAFATTGTTTPAIPRKIDFVFSRGPLRPIAAQFPIDPADVKHPASDHHFVSAEVAI